MPRSPQEIIDAIVAEASEDSCGQPKDPGDFHFYRNSWHNNAQRDYLYQLAMELAAATLVEQAQADADAR